jgi:hypothetical protein
MADQLFKIKPLKWRRPRQDERWLSDEVRLVADLILDAQITISRTEQPSGTWYEFDLRGGGIELNDFNSLAEARAAAEKFWQIELKKVLSK